MGRHSPWTPEQAEAIKDALIDWIAQGKTLRSFCGMEGMPSSTQIADWRAEDHEFRERFAQARDIGYGVIAEEALAIADTPVEGLIVTESPDGTTTRREDAINHRKLQVETRLKLVARWDSGRRPVAAKLPKITSAADLPAAYMAATEALGRGEVTAADLREIVALLDGMRAAFGEADLERRFRELEARMAKE